MRTITDNGTLTIYLERRIDADNAASVGEEIEKAVYGFAGTDIILDANELRYISSAGLRVLLKLKKETGNAKALSIIGVSAEVYDIFETTGFTELIDVKKAYRRISVDGLPVIGRGFFGTVYRYDPETIIKVYKGKDSIPMIENEKKMARKAFVSGIPTAISYDIVQVGEDYGSVFELLNAQSFHDLAAKDDDTLPEIIDQYIALLKLVHSTKMEPGELPSCKQMFLGYLDVIRECLADGQYKTLRTLLEVMPEEYTIVHGDIQMKNVMRVDGEPMLIDMDTLGQGNPVFELAGLFVAYQEFEEDDPNNAMEFLGITNEKVNDWWERIFGGYFAGEKADEQKEALVKIRLVAAIRFLYIIATSDLKNGELGARRIAHTIEHIGELLPVVTSLAL